MKKKSRAPKKFGYGIGNKLHEESEGDIYSFSTRLCERVEDNTESNEKLKEILSKIDKSDSETREDLKRWWRQVLPTWYCHIYLAIGFALGQQIDIPTPEAQREINFVWDQLRKEKVFFTYPRKKAA